MKLIKIYRKCLLFETEQTFVVTDNSVCRCFIHFLETRSLTLWQVEPYLMPYLQILSPLIFPQETLPLLSIAHLNSVSISDT